MMTVKDFEIGKSFFMRGETYPNTREIRCTDIGTRTVVGVYIEDVLMVFSSRNEDGTFEERKELIPKEKADSEGLFRPMMGCVEKLFDQDDMDVCYPTREEALAQMLSPEEEVEFRMKYPLKT